MDDYRRHLAAARRARRCAPRRPRRGRPRVRPSVWTTRPSALLRIAATVAVDAAPCSFQHAVLHALAAGATTDEVVASLEAVTPVTGAARVVQCAPKVALALGYDVDDALERLDQ